MVAVEVDGHGRSGRPDERDEVVPDDALAACTQRELEAPGGTREQIGVVGQPRERGEHDPTSVVPDAAYDLTRCLVELLGLATREHPWDVGEVMLDVLRREPVGGVGERIEREERFVDQLVVDEGDRVDVE